MRSSSGTITLSSSRLPARILQIFYKFKSDFGKSEGLTGGSLLLLQTHLGLGLSLGVILGESSSSSLLHFFSYSTHSGAEMK